MNLKFLNNGIAIFVMLIVAFLIIPLGTTVLDFLFILNLTLSLVILLITMYIKEPLEFAIFPSLLLITTLFRLVLNVSSTRSILSNGGYAGEVIATFGKFVIRGNVVVGLVVFLIIVLVQFIVITKGSERVAEVSARFTLDAMPGKQMAIDADLSSGLIDETQARDRRLKIQREADFFGSMDQAVFCTTNGTDHCRCGVAIFAVYRISGTAASFGVRIIVDNGNCFDSSKPSGACFGRGCSCCDGRSDQ